MSRITTRPDLAPGLSWDEVTLEFPTASMTVVVVGDDEALAGLQFGTAEECGPWLPATQRDPAPIAKAIDQLRAYAAGDLIRFDLPLRLRGTAFQNQVWKALLDIPYGRTVTYGQIASVLGRPGSSRAVGAAVGSNPIGIVVPCHRVIGADGSLTGFGGGLDNKVTLLAREGVTAMYPG